MLKVFDNKIFVCGIDEAGRGCPIFLKKTHENTLKILPIEVLKKYAIDLS